MTATEEVAPEAVLTATIEVPGLGLIGEGQLPELTKDLLKQVIRALRSAPPRGASRDELEEYARNGLRLKAMIDHGAPLRAIAAAPEPTMTDEEAVEAMLVAGDGDRPLVAPPSVFQQILAISEVMSKSNLLPDALRGPANLPSLRIVLLRAWDLGITQSAALESLYVVNGKIGMEGKLMAALIRRAGHSLEVVESDAQHAVWRGIRADNGDTGTGSFDLARAKTAGLIRGVNDDGTVNPQSDKKVWASYPEAMLKWRALAVLARDLFSDCLAGVSYLPEELGYIDAEAVDQVTAGGSTRAGEDEPTVTLNQQRSVVAARIAQLPPDIVGELREEWKKRGLPKPDDLRPAAIRTATRLIEAAETKAQERLEAEQGTVDEAELLDDAAPDGSRLPLTADEAGTMFAATDEAKANAAGDDELTEFCEGCGEPIGDDQHPVYDDDEKPWHVECSPSFGGGVPLGGGDAG